MKRTCLALTLAASLLTSSVYGSEQAGLIRTNPHRPTPKQRAKPKAAPALQSVPYLGALEPYFLGSGVAGAGGDTKGNWDFLIGPDYTSPNFISNETLSLVIDGKRQPIALAIHRARKSGVFFGTEVIGDLKVTVADFTNNESPWLGRLVRIVNTSAAPVRVNVTALIKPAQPSKDLVVDGGALQIAFDNSAFCFGGETKNWATRTSLITFSEPNSITANGAAYQLQTTEHIIAPHKTYSTALYHYQHYDEGRTPADYITEIHTHHPENDLTKSLAEWRKWLAKGTQLDRKIRDPKARDVIEGCLLACKMQQNRDGGTIAGTRKYSNSYVRDTHGGVRLFLATGHIAEARKAIETINHKWSVAGFIPNYWSMGSDTFLGRSFRNDASEITGYYVLMIRDYYRATKDLKFVNSVAKSMKFAIDSQLDFMAKHQWSITFNGDETEQYCVRVDGQEYGGFPAFQGWKDAEWSFASAGIACASTQFYMDYLRTAHRQPEYLACKAKLQRIKDIIDYRFLRTNGVHTWAVNKDGSWPATTIPNYDLLPLWIGAQLTEGREKSDALAMKQYINPETGYLPTAPPEVNGFCGHNLGYLLYDLKKLRDPRAKAVLNTMLNSRLFGCWGTASEFYGPNGTPNAHNFREFESGIDGEAIVRYFTGFGVNVRPAKALQVRRKMTLSKMDAEH